MDDGLDAPQRVTERERIAEVSKRDLDLDALRTEPPRIADQAAYGHPRRDQPT